VLELGLGLETEWNETLSIWRIAGNGLGVFFLFFSFFSFFSPPSFAVFTLPRISLCFLSSLVASCAILLPPLFLQSLTPSHLVASHRIDHFYLHTYHSHEMNIR